jgi:hypothetical protein
MPIITIMSYGDISSFLMGSFPPMPYDQSYAVLAPLQSYHQFIAKLPFRVSSTKKGQAVARLPFTQNNRCYGVTAMISVSLPSVFIVLVGAGNV